MSNYGHNYGDLEKLSEERRDEMDRRGAYLKSFWAIERISDGFLLNKYGRMVFDEEVNENTFLETSFGGACTVIQQKCELAHEELWPKEVILERDKAKEWRID